MLKTVVFATDAERVAPYVTDLKNLGHDVHVLGVGQPDPSTYRDGGRQKLEWLAAHSSFADDDIILCLDGYDTHVLASPDDTLRVYGSMRYPVIVAGQKTYSTDRGMQHIFGGDSPYPNPGLMIGPYRDLKNLAYEFPNEPSDNGIIQFAIVANDERWWIDTASTMFRSLTDDSEHPIAPGTVAYQAEIATNDQPAVQVQPMVPQPTIVMDSGSSALKTVVFATDEARVASYLTELQNLGHNVHVLGVGQPGWDTSREGGRQKLEWLANAGFSDDDVVLCLDGYDTRVLKTPDNTLQAYRAMGYAVIVSGEKTYWPERNMKNVFTGNSPYPCSGLMIGTYVDFKGLAAKYPDDMDDQGIIQRAVVDNDQRWWVDSNSIMFRSLSNDEANEISASTVAYHWNGPSTPAPAHWLNPHDDYILEVANDVFQLTLMSQDEAEWLTQALMRETDWKPLPGDAVPGDELRLGFREAINKRMTKLVYERWQPSNWQPIKDLFAIRYLPERQPDLALHNDKSYMSMSIVIHRHGPGGTLVLPRQNFDDRHTLPGQALLWPSAITHPHYVTPTEGMRMSLVVWTKPPPGT